MRGMLLDEETGDLMVQSGGVVIGATEQQTIGLVLQTAPGEWKESPLLGADIYGQLGGNMDRMWPQQTKKMIRACGVDVKNIEIDDDGTINIS
ncbi:MAG: hypothetical protein IKY84_06895 [Bacteroidaceae bacterium]|nr:hypothetical protein [Bacteroidaceae bacterium]